jgi:hypothetical protein
MDFRMSEYLEYIGFDLFSFFYSTKFLKLYL